MPSRRTSSARNTCAGRSEPRQPKLIAITASTAASANAATPVCQPSTVARERGTRTAGWVTTQRYLPRRNPPHLLDPHDLCWENHPPLLFAGTEIRRTERHAEIDDLAGTDRGVRPRRRHADRRRRRGGQRAVTDRAIAGAMGYRRQSRP